MLFSLILYFKKYAYFAYQILITITFISYQNAFKLFALFKQVFTTIQNKFSFLGYHL
ncbi:hypothetical protein UNSWCD_706 [Campylobacter concisus UNSWCD]|nr:hypothetical protein UNSWCD_706 [Campylobacter concisus UNSWCD]